MNDIPYINTHTPTHWNTHNSLSSWHYHRGALGFCTAQVIRGVCMPVYMVDTYYFCILLWFIRTEWQYECAFCFQIINNISFYLTRSLKLSLAIFRRSCCCVRFSLIFIEIGFNCIFNRRHNQHRRTSVVADFLDLVFVSLIFFLVFGHACDDKTWMNLRAICAKRLEIVSMETACNLSNFLLSNKHVPTQSYLFVLQAWYNAICNYRKRKEYQNNTIYII